MGWAGIGAENRVREDLSVCLVTQEVKLTSPDYTNSPSISTGGEADQSRLH